MALRDEAEAWRANVLQTMLGALAIAGPAVIAIITILRAPPRFDWYFVVLAVPMAVIAGVRFAPTLPYRLRAGLLVGMLLFACLAGIATTGFSLGGAAGIVAGIVLSVMLLGRTAALTLLVATCSILLAFGAAIQSGWSIPKPGESDPLVFSNWLRMASSLGLLTGALAVAVDYVVRQIETKYRELSSAYDELAGLHRKLETAKEEERRFIARELHDDLGQSLTALKLGLKAGKATPFVDPVRVVDGLIGKIRELSRALRPSLLDEVGLAPALDAYLEEQANDSGVDMRLDAKKFEGRLPEDLEIACFRIVQESVTNAIRHAEARRVNVRLERDPNALRLRIEDDGRGFGGLPALARAAIQGHVGIIGIRERVRALRGTFSIRSSTDAGTTIEVELPLTSSAPVSLQIPEPGPEP